ncbi:Cation-transporting ATPase [Nitrincola lacisaponensis]|uniref:Cation-transporting ATPase n=1 Tax=Nitrincola lacisaponensis TaxID=267850 RepID=A0A063Y4I1_9GAMM|nr:cation-transporting P-type ATPase [Nitrincola lacisaponensis]KDE41243.1 Cation-transporting ATPase [Nitrincola lacisaponensis]
MQLQTNKAWHHLEPQDVIGSLDSHQTEGLTSSSAQQRQVHFGPNSITGQQPVPAWKRLLLQFHNPLIYILLCATLVTFFLREYVDAGVILAVVLINAIIGYIQESKAEEAINSLKKMLSSSATVLRDGEKKTLPATELVPGDIVFLASGDKVPADMRLLECRDMQVDESALTGESVSSEKHLQLLAADTVLADRNNMAFAGTLVTYGAGKGIVTSIGDQTETGKIAHMISEAKALETPLTRKIHAFSKLLLWVILALAAVTFGVGLLYGMPASETFMAAVALAVAAIPEGLPAVVTITLAIGVRRMASRHAIIRKLSAVETLGSTTVICSDKTGTLTENQMTVQKLLAGSHSYDVSGSGYQPEGDIRQQGNSVSLSDNAALHHLLVSGLISNDSRLKEQDGRWTVEGDPTEGALIAAAMKAGYELKQCEAEFKRIDTIAFESDRQYMATLHRLDAQHNLIYLKGSVEQVLARCTSQLTADGDTEALAQDAIEARVHEFAGQGMRVLAFAMQPVEQTENTLAPFNAREPEQSMIFVGLQAMIDPPRAEAIKAVATCQKAGVRVKMITGDHALTARAIASQIGLQNNPGQQTDDLEALTGRELSELSDTALTEVADRVSVFARVAPEQKLKLVTALQSRSHVVAMTGDGVNDAPALKQADIGIAMGISGTEVSKEAADMVLTDDNFSSIEAAVEEGRNVFDNLIKFITWILPTNMGQGLVIMVAILFGITLPVLPVQALWLNMTTAVFLGLMLAFEPREAGIMSRAPREPDSPILSAEMIGRILSVSTLLLIGAFGLFQWSQLQGASIEESRTLAVTLFVVVQSFFLFNCRSLTSSIFSTPFNSNPWIWGGVSAMLIAQLLFIYTPVMNTLFHSAPLSLNQWLLMLGYGVVVLLLVEAEKAVWRKRKG